jgi:FlaA1/EpsC-like NDP-sugar epimerase
MVARQKVRAAVPRIAGSLGHLDGRRILVTGGTGSFGRTFVQLCLAHSKATEIAVYSRDEQKHVAMQRFHGDLRVRSIVGDVRDVDRLRFAMRGIDYVFNAAAIKHVHFTEEHPMEAVRTNVLGADNVCRAALDAGVRCLVTLSTDKAVEPVNAMGMSKALQERVVGGYAGSGMRVGIVRYGNVLDSNGSVVPLFRSLIEQGRRELPVTDRRMTRFSLSLTESVGLVAHAMRRCRDGETFVLDAPAFDVWSLAEVVAEHAQAHGRKVRVREVGIRPGEKLHETLISPEEMRRARRDRDVWVIRRYQSADEAFAASRPELRLSSDAVRRLTKPEIRRVLHRNDCLPRFAGASRTRRS